MEIAKPGSFRLLTEYHSFLLGTYETRKEAQAELLVSVSLRSIIHSYISRTLTNI